MFGKKANSEDKRCSFCHKTEAVVGKLVSSPSDYERAYICDGCIAVCNSIMEDDARGRVQDDPEETFQVRLTLTYLDGIFDMTRSEAKQLRDQLNKILGEPS